MLIINTTISILKNKYYHLVQGSGNTPSQYGSVRHVLFKKYTCLLGTCSCDNVVVSDFFIYFILIFLGDGYDSIQDLCNGAALAIVVIHSRCVWDISLPRTGKLSVKKNSLKFSKTNFVYAINHHQLMHSCCPPYCQIEVSKYPKGPLLALIQTTI